MAKIFNVIKRSATASDVEEHLYFVMVVMQNPNGMVQVVMFLGENRTAPKLRFGLANTDLQ